MKTTITPSRRGCLVKLNDETRRSIEALGALAEELVQGQDVALWVSASDVGFLKMVRRGAEVLRHFGVHAIVELIDADAHRALVTCHLLSLRASELPARARRTLRQALVILAKCCSVRIEPHMLPPFQRLPADLKGTSRLAQLYQSILGDESVSLLALLRLCKRLEHALAPEFVPLTCKLRKMTGGLERALEKTRFIAEPR
jgi:hypothetical protein